jgi:uncharacterized protein YgfB (UPF0149 family)
MIWINEGDEPVLVKARVQGKDGFKVLAIGEDDDEIVFASQEALVGWVNALSSLTECSQSAQPYEEWLEGQQ